MSLIDREGALDAILAMARQDYFGLYEVVWFLRGNYRPNATEHELIDVAREIVKSLLVKDLVLVLFRITSNESWPIDTADVNDVLQSMDSWRPPVSWEVPYPCLSTPAG